jgi:Mg/Co/Ni transporter MgtE
MSMKPISLTVSEELHQEMQKFKEFINFSKIFRVAAKSKIDEIKTQLNDSKFNSLIKDIESLDKKQRLLIVKALKQSN